jgi:hypothetical protein
MSVWGGFGDPVTLPTTAVFMIFAFSTLLNAGVLSK